MKTLIAIALLSCATLVEANEVKIGEITLTGEFTQNPGYDWNNPSSVPWGTFGALNTSAVTGMFAPFVSVGMILPSQTLWTAGDFLPIFAIGGYSFSNSLGVLIAGASSVSADVTLTGNGYVQNPDESFLWIFDSPLASEGPITLYIRGFLDNHSVPENGSTWTLFGVALLGLVFIKRFTPRKPDTLFREYLRFFNNTPQWMIHIMRRNNVLQ
jgi:hypothetical protein